MFFNDESLGRLKKSPDEYRFRWDNVTYTPRDVRVHTWRSDQRWATDSVRTAGTATDLKIDADCESVISNGEDLCFVTASVHDNETVFVPDANPDLSFSVCGPGEIIAVANGFPSRFDPFSFHDQEGFHWDGTGYHASPESHR